jgi:dihydrofolate reductase
MVKLRVHCFAMSLDGYGAGPRQTLTTRSEPEGLRCTNGLSIRARFTTHGKDGGATGVDDDFVARGFENTGAWIIGRNMFGPVRGPWPDDSWKGWWGEDPPYHTPVFVLTHYPRSSLTMKGRTTFHFVTDGIQSALARAREASQGKDIRLGGGVATIRECLRDGVIDEMHLAYAPVFLGSGECLLAEMDLPALGYQVTSHITTVSVMHVLIAKKNP